MVCPSVERKLCGTRREIAPTGHFFQRHKVCVPFLLALVPPLPRSHRLFFSAVLLYGPSCDMHTHCVLTHRTPHTRSRITPYTGHTSPVPSVFLQQYRKICPNILPDRFVYITSNQLSNPGLLVGFPFMTPASLRLAGDAQDQARKLPPGLKICIVNN